MINASGRGAASSMASKAASEGWIHLDFPQHQGSLARLSDPAPDGMTWPRAGELQDRDQKSLSKRRRHSGQSWEAASSVGHGVLHGIVVRMQPSAAGTRTMLYIKEGRSIGVVLVPTAKTGVEEDPRARAPLVGDAVGLRITEFRPLENVPRVDQTVCLHFSVGIAAEWWFDEPGEDGEMKTRPAQLPWSRVAASEEFGTLAEASSAGSMAHLRLLVDKPPTSSSADGQEAVAASIWPVLCRDRVGSVACCKMYERGLIDDARGP